MARKESPTGIRAVFAGCERRMRRLRRKLRHAIAAWRISRKARKVSLADLANAAGPVEATDFLVVSTTEGADAAGECLACVRSILAGAIAPETITVVAPAKIVDGVRDTMAADASRGTVKPSRIVFERIYSGYLLEALERGLGSAVGGKVVICNAAARFAPDASLWLAAAAARFPGCKALYADHELVSGTGSAGRAVGIHHKPAFSWLYLLARDFVEPFMMYDRQTAAAAVAELRKRSPGCRSARGLLYAVALEATHGLARQEVVHLPHPLAARREDSSLDAEELVAICAADLAARGVAADVAAMPGEPEVRNFNLRPVAMPHVSIIIPTKNGADLVEQCISSLRATAGYPNYDITVIDHESDEEKLLRYLAAESAAGRVRVMPYAGPFNFATMNNAAVRETRGELLLFLNNDIDAFSQGWLAQLVATLAIDARVAAVGSLLYFPDGAIQHAGVVLNTKRLCEHVYHGAAADARGYRGRLRSIQEYSAVTAALLLVRRDAFERIGGFDEHFPNDYNDIDLCLRFREAGFGIAYSPHASATHWESRTRTAKETGKDLFVERWKSFFPCDPFHHAGMNVEGTWVGPSILAARARSRLELQQILLGLRGAA